LRIRRVFEFRLFERLLDLDARLRGLHDVEPVLLRRLLRRGENLDLVAALERMVDAHVAAVDFGAHAARAELGVNQEGKVEHGSPFGQLVEVAVGGEDEYLFVVEVHLEVAHELVGRGVVFERLADVAEPLVDAAFAPFDALILPVGGKAARRFRPCACF
jgi:hypothetical protein